jgi:hypothetical protein
MRLRLFWKLLTTELKNKLVNGCGEKSFHKVLLAKHLGCYSLRL